MVRGRGIAVIAVALMYQCAEITRIARGRGTDPPKARHASVYRLRSRVFIGLPWPMNAAGMVEALMVAILRSDPGPGGRVGSSASPSGRHSPVVRAPASRAAWPDGGRTAVGGARRQRPHAPARGVQARADRAAAQRRFSIAGTRTS